MSITVAADMGQARPHWPARHLRVLVRGRGRGRFAQRNRQVTFVFCTPPPPPFLSPSPLHPPPSLPRHTYTHWRSYRRNAPQIPNLNGPSYGLKGQSWTVLKNIPQRCHQANRAQSEHGHCTDKGSFRLMSLVTAGHDWDRKPRFRTHRDLAD